jgi:hypothetical protein
VILYGDLFRIDQVSAVAAREYSCWSPTVAVPACFHKPRYFGEFVLA